MTKPDLRRSKCKTCKLNETYADARFPYCGIKMWACLKEHKVVSCSEFEKINKGGRDE
jgi:hypothetical protein